MNIVLKPAPQIKSIGLPPEKHAERVVDEMLEWMHHARAKLEDAAKGTLDPRKMGGVEGQKKALKKLLDGLGWMGLDCEGSFAKRGKYEFMVTVWTLWSPIDDDFVPSRGPLPRPAWLAASTAIFTGRNYQARVQNWPFLLVSRHACVRLAERAGVRTIFDLVMTMRDLWSGTADVINDHPGMAWASPPDGHWRVPVGDCWAILEPDKNCREGERLVVKTILSKEMVEA